MKKLIVVLVILLTACASEPETITVQETVEVPVTVEVVQEVEVTRVVEVEVTREIEVTREVEVIVTATAPPTPIPSPTPEGPEEGSRENPYPLGQTVQLVSGAGYEFTFTVNSTVLRGIPALTIIKQFNQFNPDPPEGQEFMLLRLEVEYNGPDVGTLTIGKSNLAIVTNGRIFDYFDLPSVCCLNPDFDLELLQGGVGEGMFAAAVDIDDESPLLRIGGDDGLFFSLTE